jgi:hypothetical protein
MDKDQLASWDDKELIWHAQHDALDGDELEAINGEMTARDIDVEAVYVENEDEHLAYNDADVDWLLTDAAELLRGAADALKHSEDVVARLVLERLSQRVMNVQAHLRKEQEADPSIVPHDQGDDDKDELVMFAGTFPIEDEGDAETGGSHP